MRPALRVSAEFGANSVNKNIRFMIEDIEFVEYLKTIAREYRADCAMAWKAGRDSEQIFRNLNRFKGV